MRRVTASIRRCRPGAVVAAAALAASGLAFSGCETKTGGANLVAGKQAFVAKCGVCHVLNRAGAKGNVGPNLDQAFQQALKDGFKRDSVLGIVERQILYPNKSAGSCRRSSSPGRLELLEGRSQEVRRRVPTAHDVAAYVATVVNKPGKDEGLLATAVGGVQKALATAVGGVLKIPRRPQRAAALHVQERRGPGRPAGRPDAQRRRDAAQHRDHGPRRHQCPGRHGSGRQGLRRQGHASSPASTPSCARCPATRRRA